jgi:hypothetical protein
MMEVGPAVPERDSVTAEGEGTIAPGGPTGVDVGEGLGVGIGDGVDVLELELQAPSTATKARARKDTSLRIARAFAQTRPFPSFS